MPRKRRHAKQRHAEVPDLIRKYFEEEIRHTFFHDNDEIAGAWAQIGDEIVADWVRDKPGTRPHFWRRIDAPPSGRLSNAGNGRETLDIPIAPPAPAAQTAFLRRHGLFLPGEERRLDSNSFAPP